MTIQEKNLYQQIHPLRLATDWLTGLGACWLFWQRDIWWGVTLSFLPSLVVSLLLIRFADLEKVKNSRFGAYFHRTYNRTVDLTRFAGFVLLAASSWWQLPAGMAAGLLVIAGTWTYGLFVPR